MGKKNFIEGLESLLQEASAGTLTGGANPLLDKSRTAAKTGAGKSFSSGIEQALQDALESSLDQAGEEDQDKSRKLARTKPSAGKSVMGLDALIRSTIETSKIELDYNNQKRVTFTFDPVKLEKLRKIAKKERAYLREIIGKLVSEYISSYEKEKGGLD